MFKENQSIGNTSLFSDSDIWLALQLFDCLACLIIYGFFPMLGNCEMKQQQQRNKTPTTMNPFLLEKYFLWLQTTGLILFITYQQSLFTDFKERVKLR